MPARPNRDRRHHALALLELVLPSPCLSCSDPTGAWCPQLGLCVACRGQLARPLSACHTCGEPIHGALTPTGYRCGSCRRTPPAFDQLVAPYLYRPPLDAVIRHLKYHRLAYLGRHLARAILDASDGRLSGAELVTAVPLHWRRQLARGFNQALEIARPLAQELGIELRATLRRERATRPQAELSRAARHLNPSEAFRPRRTSRPPARTVVLVDDVMTTGATLEEAARVLKTVGVERVIAVVAGRTPPPEYRHPAGPKRPVGRLLETPDARSRTLD